ncbi:MAG: GNAT family N-acetyltransferase [Flavobacteriales bacterium]
MLSVRLLEKEDIPKISQYWLQSSDEHLIGMGVDLKKRPNEEELKTMLKNQLELPLKEKKALATIWELEGKPIGHCNVNKIIFGEEAYIHLHIWDKKHRKSGLGAVLFKASVELFLKELQLKRIVCEPYADNPAPNNLLKRASFQFVKTYSTIPGTINFEQMVNRWVYYRND